MFAIVAIFIALAQGNAILNDDSSPIVATKSTKTVEQLYWDRRNAWEFVGSCTLKMIDGTRVNCDAEKDHYNKVSQQYLDAVEAAKSDQAHVDDKHVG